MGRFICTLAVLCLAGCNLYAELDTEPAEAVEDAGLEDTEPVENPFENHLTEVCGEDSTRDYCARRGAQCGIVAGKDICGQDVAIRCGSCSGGLICHDDHRCACESESVSQYCARFDAECGSVEGVDGCGVQRDYACGVCEEGPCENNQCTLGS
ncbi:MAG: hypothetical protein ACNA8W_08855 [Bradymonadaceae bacterium]